VVDQHVDLAGLFGQAVDLVDIHQLGTYKAGSAPLGFDGSDDLSASLRVAAMDDNVPSVSGQAERSRSADAVGRPGHERCSNSSRGGIHRILISLQNGRTRASRLSPWEAQERIWRLTLTLGETEDSVVTSTLAIGDFSRATHLSARMLRHYHELGLLEPVDVDADSGYRRYAPEQIVTAQVLRRFRDLDMPLEDIQVVLQAPDVETRNRVISNHLARLESDLARAQDTVASLRSLLDRPQDSSVLIDHRHVAATPAAAITDIV